MREASRKEEGDARWDRSWKSMHYPEQSFAQSLTENEEKVERKKRRERERERGKN